MESVAVLFFFHLTFEVIIYRLFDGAGPCAPPEAPAGSFEVINTRLETRAATLYWSPLAVFCRNGDPSGYVVDMTDLHGHLLSVFVSNLRPPV